MIVDYKTKDDEGRKFSKGDQWLKDYTTLGTDVVALHSNDVIMGKKRQSEFCDHMSDLGYDAFVDPYNGSTKDIYDYPLVVLKPDEKFKQTESYSFMSPSHWDEPEEIYDYMKKLK